MGWLFAFSPLLERDCVARRGRFCWSKQFTQGKSWAGRGEKTGLTEAPIALDCATVNFKLSEFSPSLACFLRDHQDTEDQLSFDPQCLIEKAHHGRPTVSFH